MKRQYYSVIILLLISLFGSAQAPGIALNQVYSQFPTTEYGASITTTADGGYAVASVSAANAWIFKLDASGTMQWNNYLPNDTTTGLTTIYDIHQTTDNGYIIAGSDYAFSADSIGNHSIRDFMVIKLDENGNITWIKALGGSSNEEARSVTQTTDGGFIVVGYTNSNDGDLAGNPTPWYTEYWVVKLDASGNIVWQKAFGGSNYDYATAVTATSDGGAIVAGYSGSKDGDASGTHWGGSDDDVWVIKLDSSGNLEWQNSYGGSAADQAMSIATTSDGGYIVAGSTTSNDGLVSGIHDPANALSDFWIIKINATGTLVWQKCLGGTGSDIAYSVKQTSDGGYIVGGTVGPTNSGTDITGYHGNAGTDYWMTKLDGSGNLTWQKCLGGSNTEDGRSVAETQDGGYIIAGTEQSPDGDVNYTTDVLYSHIWVVKLGGSATAGITEQENVQPLIYPNPAREKVTVHDLPAGTCVTLTDLNGRILYETVSTGTDIEIITGDFASGTTFLQTSLNGNSQTNKLIINH